MSIVEDTNSALICGGNSTSLVLYSGAYLGTGYIGMGLEWQHLKSGKYLHFMWLLIE